MRVTSKAEMCVQRGGLKILAEALVGGEAGDAGGGEFLVAEGDGGAAGWGGIAFLVGEAGADGEGDAVGEAAFEGAEAALVAAGAGEVGDDDGFVV